jgi:hypothetical protein
MQFIGFFHQRSKGFEPLMNTIRNQEPAPHSKHTYVIVEVAARWAFGEV